MSERESKAGEQQFEPAGSGLELPAGRLPGNGKEKMNSPLAAQNEQGFILVVTLIMLLLLVVLGISATTTSMIESRIAGTESVYRATFYQADGGVEVAALLIEENVSCPEGFAANSGADTLIGDALDGILVFAGSRSFWQNEQPDSNANPVISDNLRDLYFPASNPFAVPRTNIRVGGRVVMAQGGAIQMAAGYQGKGKAAAGGAASLMYDVYVQHLGPRNSESRLQLQWRHAIGQEGSCNY
jgi:hypothetical protein